MKNVNLRLIVFLLMLISCVGFYYDADKFLKPNQTFNAKVQNLIEYKGWVYVNDSVAVDGYNLEYKKFRYISEVLELKDSISVDGNDDTLYIFKPNGKTYSYLKRTYPDRSDLNSAIIK